MASIPKSTRDSILQRFLGRLRFPQLFLVLTGLFALDFFIPDPIPFLDEAILGLLAILLGMWKERESEAAVERPPEKNITPPDQRPAG